MKTGLRSYLVGMHNPLLHAIMIIIAWIRIYHNLPTIKELICILFHDIGYITQTTIDGFDNKHPELGAWLCGSMLGRKHFVLCIAHSRVYAKKLGISLSKLGYADKASILIFPNWLFKRIILIGGEAEEYYQTSKTRKWGYPVDVRLIKADYARWVKENTTFYGGFNNESY